MGFLHGLYEAQTMALLLGDDEPAEVALSRQSRRLLVHTRLMVQNEETLMSWYRRALEESPHARQRTSPDPADR